MIRDLELQYYEILKEELLPALGCTEPVAIAYAAAIAKAELGQFPSYLEVRCSRNIIKNARGVVIPHTKSLRGVRAAAILGALAGDASRQLEVLKSIKEDDVLKTKEYLKAGYGKEVLISDEIHPLHIVIVVKSAKDTVEVQIAKTHTNVIRVLKNGKSIYDENVKKDSVQQERIDRDVLNMDDILSFSRHSRLNPVIELLILQKTSNYCVAKEGIQNEYGACVGRSILREQSTASTLLRAKAYAAAGSDARMSGCELPVVINSGSGNQGITISVPLTIYAEEKRIDNNTFYRALMLANLVAIYQKSLIGSLSAYCGAVSAAAGTAAGLSFMRKASDQQIKDAVVNTLASTSGMICDGAKPSCAAKIAAALDSAMTSVEMAMDNRAFQEGCGIVKANADKTIQAVGELAVKGMSATDYEILSIMLRD